MKRNVSSLTHNKFDLLVVGGGIHGAMTALQASLLGLQVALIDQRDFAYGTSSNTQKVIHGGLRYLQNLNFSRIWSSAKARQRLIHLAPHLVYPLPCVMPIYGHGLRGRELVWAGLQVYNFIGKDRKRFSGHLDLNLSGVILPVSKTEQLIPGLEKKKLNAAAHWYDAICYNTERLVLSCVKSASEAGAVVANYLKATRFNIHKDSSISVECQDILNHESFDILAKNVINCAGPWINDIFQLATANSLTNKIPFICGVNVITRQIFPHSTAVGIRSSAEKNSALYFVVPWRGKSIIGTEWFPYHGTADEFRVNELQCAKLIAGFNKAYPPAKLTLDDILYVHAGLVPGYNPGNNANGEIKIEKKFRIINHCANRTRHLVSISGVKYTTAGHVAGEVLRYVFPKIRKNSFQSSLRLIGGDIEDFSVFLKIMSRKWKPFFDEPQLVHLLRNYGTEAELLLKKAKIVESPPQNKHNKSYDLLKGETLFAVHEEMAQKLTDLVFRRTDKGTAGYPLEADLDKMSFIMAKELDWSEKRRYMELEEVSDFYPSFISRP
jgi:glycerol-3-phosphate dehydrogenase